MSIKEPNQYSEIQEPLEIDLKKCGEIFIAMNSRMDGMVYALNCIYCETICNSLEIFSEHIEQNHNEDLFPEHFGDEIDLVHSVAMNSIVSAEEDEDIEIDPEEGHLKYSPNEFDPLNEVTLSVESINDRENDEESDRCSNTSDVEMSDIEDTHENEVKSTSDTFSYPDHGAQKIDLDSKNIPKISNVPFILSIIQEYKIQEILWDEDHPLYEHKRKQQEALEELTRNVNKQNTTTFDWKIILEVIRKIRHRYRQELRKIKSAEMEGKIYKPTYFFEGLSFLREIVENKLETYTLKLDRPLPISNLNTAQVIKFIKIYENYPCLWDVEHINYRFKNKRKEAEMDMIKDLQTEISSDITEYDVRRIIHRIRYACMQENNRKMQCEQLQEEYQPTCEYYKEISFLKGNVGPFKCDVCQHITLSPDIHRIHKSSHDGSMPFSCPICNRGFSSTGSLSVHIRRHTRDFPYKCKTCGKGFPASTDLTVHMRYHTGEKPYFCDVCGKSFPQWAYFDSHMRRHNQLPTHKCTVCAKTFYENYKLVEHMKSHLNIRDKVCNICGKAFTTSKNLRQHKYIHDEKKKYNCKICDKSFSQYAGLSGHLKSHGTTLAGATPIEDGLAE